MMDSIQTTLQRCEELIQVGEARAAAEVAMARLRDLCAWLEEVPAPEQTDS